MGEGASIFDRLEAFAARRAAIVLMALWAAAEAIVLPIVPDVGLCLLVLAAPGQAGRLFAAVVAGAVAGTLALAALASTAPDAVNGLLLALPGIDGAVLADAGSQLARDGIVGFAQIGAGPPLKVYTAEWVELGGGVPGLVVGSILNRLTRIGPPLLVAIAAGRLFRYWIRRHERVTLVAYAAFWTAVYVVLWT